MSVYHSDLQVSPVSSALDGWKLDVVVSGSIGAVESVRFIRALRRLGAEVTPWLTSGGSQFITKDALSWAAGKEAVTCFSGSASHVASGDGCIVSPASANIIGKVAHGITDTPASALITSYLGQKKPVLMLPNMHDSLLHAPAVAANIAQVKTYGIEMLEARVEEGKQKFPSPPDLADQCSHRFNTHKSQSKPQTVLVTMGTTRGYIDDVRYISNYSSGALGTEVTKELFRNGFWPLVVCGPCPVQPTVGSKVLVKTNDEMAAAIADALAKKPIAAVCAASVLDFVPEKKTSGKIKSADHDHIDVRFTKTKKLIEAIPTPIKVGFKLETGLSDEKAEQLAAEYIAKYKLSMFVINDLSEVSATEHRAQLFFKQKTGISKPSLSSSKADLARSICQHILTNR